MSSKEKPVQEEAVAWQKRYAHKLPAGGMANWQWATKAEYDARDKPWPDWDYEWRELFTQPPAPVVQSEVSPASTSPTIAAPGDVEQRALDILSELTGRSFCYSNDGEIIGVDDALEAIKAALRSQGQADAVGDGAVRRVAKALNGYRFDESTPEQAWRGLHAKERRYWDSMAEAAIAALAQQANK